jgi:hypothetical protein
MAQTALTVVQLKLNNYAVAAGDLVITPAAMDVTNGNSFPATGTEILLFQNTDTASHTITITSVADPYGRTDSSLTTYAIAAGVICVIEMKQLQGWLESGALVYLSTTNALVKVAVMRTT